MWLSNKRSLGERARTLSRGNVLDEQTFWQIVRTEKERADRSGVPVTIAVFTVQDDKAGQGGMAGWNASTLCSALRSTARMTDHVGIAGANEVGAILWGTRELGAYRFVNRLGEKANNLASDCKLFVYPTLTGEHARPTRDESSENPSDGSSSEHDILDRIADVEQKLSEAQEVETAVVKEEDCPVQDEVYGYGANPGDLPEESDTSCRFTQEFGIGTAVAPPRSSETKVDAVLSRLALDGSDRRSQVLGGEPDSNAVTQSINLTVEPMENLFVFPHPFWKRALDLVGSVMGLLVLSPLMFGVAAAVKLSSPGPILFRQAREGHGGKLFTILKFRTMRVGADAEKAQLQAANEQHGPAFKMTNDPRITAVGSFLRKTCLDELPQLWNVLKGDMTLVGPRPLDHRESSRIARWGRRRLHVMPGLTCIWQVHGKSKVTFNEWMRMDIRYSQKVSFVQDIKLVLQTLKQVILRKASQ